MMKIPALCFALIIPATLNIFAQDDPAALKILDKFSSAAISAPSVSMSFDLVTDDQVEGVRNSVPGSIIISGNKYKLDLKDNIIWYNGKTSWSYLTAEKEVTVTEPGKEDNSFYSRPSEIFTMYKKGFKNRLAEENADSYIIDLFPEDIKSDYIRVRLVIGKSVMNLKKLEYKNKNGLTVTIEVNTYNLKQQPEPASFDFNPAAYKGVEIIDLR